MAVRALAALIIASALITFEGTATTVALPSIGNSLGLTFSLLQWIGNASLLTMAALLVPAGIAGDRFGRVRSVRVGLSVFAASSLLCAATSSSAALIAARFVQGAGAALVLPGALAILRTAYSEDEQRVRIFGRCAAATACAAAVGPIVAGVLSDAMSWRLVFVVSGAIALLALVLLRGCRSDGCVRREPVPYAGAAALTVFLVAVTYVIMALPVDEWHEPSFVGAVLTALGAGLLLARVSPREGLVPAAILRSRNCAAGNAATFCIYFGLFGLSFLLALYTQQSLGYSVTGSALALVPMSVMTLLLAERLGNASVRFGSRITITAGAVIAAAGLLWIATSPDDPIPFWTRIVAGGAVFGVGVSVTLSPLTHVTVASVPVEHASAASGVNHATARAAGLVAIAALGSIASTPQSNTVSADGLSRALFVCATLLAVVGTATAALLKESEPGGLRAGVDSE